MAGFPIPSHNECYSQCFHHQKMTQLQDRAWTLASIADEMDVHWYTAQRWRTGAQYPYTPKPVLMAFDGLLKRKRIPKKRRDAMRSRRRARMGTPEGKGPS